MNDKDPKSSPDNGKQSVGIESTNCKRSSGIFSFFKWLRPSGSASRESLSSDKTNNTNNSSSCESLSSVQSSGTVASFSFVEPSAYSNNLTHKKIPPSPETDTYKARIKQRDQRREKDKNLTLRKKYNLFFGRDTIVKTVPSPEENSRSLPLMTKPALKEESREEGFHRRTNSDSSKVKKAGAYVHVKGKRKAPQPPGNTEDNSNATLKRTTKRLAPQPPEQNSTGRSESPSFRKSEITFESEQIEVTSNEEKNITIQSYKQIKEENSRKHLNKREDSNFGNIQIETSTSSLFDSFGKSNSQEIKSNRDSILLDDRFQSENDRNTALEKNKTEFSLNGILESASSSDVISNDSLKLDHGILKPVKDEEQNIYSECSPFSSKEPVDDSKPWYKRQETSAQLKKEFFKSSLDNKYEPIDVLPEVSFTRNPSVELKQKDTKKEDKIEKKKEDKRKSGVSLLANISELDREAAEILQREKMRNADNFQEMPEFMKPKDENKGDTDTWVTPKRRSARDLIAKFNAITNVTKATVNTAFFGSTQKRDYFGKSSSKDMKKKQEALLESHKKRLEMIDNKINHEKKTTMAPLMKSESASVVKKPDTPKTERKSWNCPKCYVENEYWRIICHVCSAIKPYFDDLSASPNLKKSDKSFVTKDTNQNQYERILERSKTQIGFSALTNMTSGKNKNKTDLYTNAPSENTNKSQDRKEEREKLKKMLIEMKNSLPKKTYTSKIPGKQQIITEKPELEVKKIETTFPNPNIDSSDSDNEEVEDIPSKIQVMIKQEEKKEENVEEKVASILIGTKETIYENIKVKRTSDPKPIKVSSSVQTTSVISKPPEPSKRVNVTTMVKKKNSFEPMKVQDFEDIYSDKNGSSAARIYANLAQNDELSLFFNMPKNLTEMKNTLSKMKLQNRNKDTIEINRLLRKLEVAIAKGDLTQAADFAKELAHLRVNCSVIRQKSSSEEKEVEKDGFSVDMYVEDKVSHRGPFPFQVRSNQTVGELKKQVEKEFEIPVDVQRWILGKELATDDKATLKDNNITEGCPIFLYLVAPDLAATENQEKPLKTDEPSTSSQNSEINPKENRNDQTKLYPEINASKSGVYPDIPEDAMKTEGPKIINAIPKAVETSRKEENAGSSSSSSSGQNLEEKGTETRDVKPEKHFFNDVVTQTVTTALFAPELEKEEPENFEDYDVKTLKPNRETQEWECHLCTLLNPVNSNICGVCATVRQIAPIKKERKNSTPKASAPQASPDGQTYRQLMNLDNEDIVHNAESFECVICFSQVKPKEGVTLRECLHQFCKECVRHTVEFSEEAEIRCPYRDNDYSCNIALQDREIKALVSKTVYDQHLAKSVSQAENKIDKSFHCKTPDCKGWCIFEDNVNEFRCPVCRRVNCLTCQAIHMGLNCKQYQQRMTEEAECDEDAKQTRQMLDRMVKNGEALKCPTCHVIMMKKWGCDWLRCSMCKTEICWVTRGPRWGPGGKGDTSGGCQCGVNGVKCHPKCNYCH